MTADHARSGLGMSAGERAAYTAGLRQLADWLDANPDIELPWTGGVYQPFQLGVWLSKEELAEIVRALPGRVEKEFDETVVRVNATFDGLRVQAYSGRNEVCERIVVGTETVTVPAVDAAPERTEEREVVEWRCHPILADEQVSA
jgi:hypothetical protein